MIEERGMKRVCGGSMVWFTMAGFKDHTIFVSIKDT